MMTYRLARLDTVRCGMRERLRGAARSLGVADAPMPAFDGGLLRPLVALGFATDRRRRGELFWLAALAVELAHEASLVHDDIIDDARIRRGQASSYGDLGVGRALVLGDHYLTLAYRAAAATRSLTFIDHFTRAVERTVAGERAQGATAGKRVEWTEYRDIVLGKSGELIGCAAAASASVGDTGLDRQHHEIGQRLGLLYQMLDDLLDYCPAAMSGKLPFADYRQRRWTWVLDHLPTVDFDVPTDEIHRELFTGGDWSPARQALDRFDAERRDVRRLIASLGGRARMLESLIEHWGAQARMAVEAESVALAPASPPAPPMPQAWSSYFAKNSRSFRFAAWALPAGERDRIARVYAFCRYTDDLVDVTTDRPATLMARLDGWLECARASYHGGTTRVPLLDVTMREMAASGTPFTYVEELVAGMSMDVRAVRYRTLDDLRLYTYRVASTVGLWLTELYGIHGRWMLDRAASLGHAMQLTNIIRDVGEDLDRGRVYLPEELLDAHGLTRDDLHAMRAGAPVSSRYRDMIDVLMRAARSEYDAAQEAIPHLPAAFGRAVSIAGAVYAAILDNVVHNEFDNLRQRAHTSFARKMVIGSAAMLSWRASRARVHRHALRVADG
jgi:phytoene synthase